MRLGEKIPVPELSANQAARLQRRVLAQVAAQPAVSGGWFGDRLRFAVAAVAIAGVALAVAINVKGAVDGRGGVVAGTGASVTELVTGDDAVTVKLGAASVTLAPQTAASIIRRTNGGIDIALDRGRVDCEVAPIAGREPLRVGAGDVEVEVVGTVFAVELSDASPEGAGKAGRNKATIVRVEVERGVVVVRSPSGEVRVTAGKMWTELDGLVSMVAEVDSELVIDEPGSGARSADDSSDPSDSSSGALDRPAASPRSTNAKTREQRKPRRPKVSTRRAPPRHSAPDNPELLAAMKLETGDPREAVRQYESIAATSRGRVASFALYSKAYVEYFKLGDKRAALATLDFFNRRFKGAREAQSAQWLRVLGLCAIDRTAECRAAAYSYIRRFPGGKFVNAATEVVNRD